MCAGRLLPCKGEPRSPVIPTLTVVIDYQITNPLYKPVGQPN